MLGAGRTRLALTWSYQEFDRVFVGKDAVTDRTNTENLRWTLDLNAAHQIVEEFRLDVTVPFVHVETDVTSPPMGPLRARREADLGGLGDITVLGLYSPWAGEDWGEDHEHGFFDLHNLHFIAGFKAPTGNENENADVPPDGRGSRTGSEFRQTGTGTWDALVGFTYAAPLAEDWRLFSTTIATIPLSDNDFGKREGVKLDEKLGVAYTPVEKLTLFLSADAQWRRPDTGGTVPRFTDNSGGFFLSVTPGLDWEFAEGIGFETSVSLPVHRDVRGEQLVPGPLYAAGFYWRF